MSRNNKQRRNITMRKHVTKVHQSGGKIPRTQKLTSPKKGKCNIRDGKRVSINL